MPKSGLGTGTEGGERAIKLFADPSYCKIKLGQKWIRDWETFIWSPQLVVKDKTETDGYFPLQ